MQDATLEHRITVLLDLLDPDTAEALLSELPEARSRLIRQQMERLRAEPPTDDEIDEIIAEFERFFRLVEMAQPQDVASRASDLVSGESTSPVAGREDLQSPTADDPLGDLQRISPLRLAAALREETPHTIALLMSQIPEARAAEVLQKLPDEKRYQTFLQMRETPLAPAPVVTHLARVAVARGMSLSEDAMQFDEEDIDTKLARMLRSMDRTQQFSIMGSFEEKDAEAASRIRNMLYVCEDLIYAADRTMQQLLGEIDSRTLALALSEADEPLREKAFNNLSRRARQTLEEELELLGSVSREEIAEAKQRIVQAMAEMDQRGELEMEQV